MAAHIAAGRIKVHCDLCPILKRAAQGEPDLGYTAEDATAQLAQWGCDGNGSARTAAFRFRGEVIELIECPAKTIDPAIAEAFSFCQWSIDGQWPVPGGLLAQSTTLYAATCLVSAEMGRIDREEAEKVRAGNGR